MQYRKIINEINNNYTKVKNESFGQNGWSSQGRKISNNIATFEKLDNNLNKGVAYVKENSLERNNEKTIEQIEALLEKAKKTTIPQIQAIKEKTKYFESNFEMNQTSEDNSLPQQQEIVMDLMNNKEVLEQRRKELEGIHKTAAILKDTTDQMAQDVHKQGQVLEEIEANVLTTKDNAEKAKKEITDANEMSKSNSKRMSCFIFIIVVAIGVIVAIVLSIVLPLVNKDDNQNQNQEQKQ